MATRVSTRKTDWLWGGDLAPVYLGQDGRESREVGGIGFRGKMIDFSRLQNLKFLQVVFSSRRQGELVLLPALAELRLDFSYACAKDFIFLMKPRCPMHDARMLFP